MRRGRDGVACCCACTSLEDGLLPQWHQQPLAAAEGALMWVLPCARCRLGVRAHGARARLLFIQCVLFLDSVPAGDQFPEACAEDVIGADDVYCGRITLDSRGRTLIERMRRWSFGTEPVHALRLCTRRTRRAGIIAPARRAQRAIRNAVRVAAALQIAVLSFPPVALKRATSR